MEIKIHSVIPGQSHYHHVEVFGYNSKSQPGLEINGLNGKGRIIKEKITFISKKRKLKYPLKRFVLCVEGEGLDKSQIEYLELPLMICFWSMAGILPINRLDNCFAAAKVSLDGKLKGLQLNQDVVSIMETVYRSSFTEGEHILYLGETVRDTKEGERDERKSFFQPMDIVSYLDETVGGFKAS
jgi:hypothetical protein